jgi:hypothetical protein
MAIAERPAQVSGKGIFQYPQYILAVRHDIAV